MVLFATPVLAIDLCIDLVAPEAPENLGFQGNVELYWDEPNDKPDCSGIAYYKIYRDGLFLDNSLKTSFICKNSLLSLGKCKSKVIE